jgi:hypothetical protein
MNVVDENVPERQVSLLQSWRLRPRQIGHDLGRSGMQDREIVSLLHSLTRPTLFTLDRDFAGPAFCHQGYCLVYIDLKATEFASVVRRVLRHPQLNTWAKRAGAAIRVGHSGMRIWRRNAVEQVLPWPSQAVG